MANHWSNPDKFLAFVNRRVYWEDGEVREKNEDEIEGQQVLPLDTCARFIFAKKVDLIIQGFCADMTGWRPTETLPMGGMLGYPDQSWLHTIIPEEPWTILLFSDCCGSYSKEYQEMLRRIFPNVLWLFPNMVDLYDNFGASRNIIRAVQCFVKADIIGIEKK